MTCSPPSKGGAPSRPTPPPRRHLPSTSRPSGAPWKRRGGPGRGGPGGVGGTLDPWVAPCPRRGDPLAAPPRHAEAEPLQRAAHAFKSAAGTIGAGRLAALLEDMERAARDGDVAGACDKLEHVRGEAQAALNYLRTATKGG